MENSEFFPDYQLTLSSLIFPSFQDLETDMFCSKPSKYKFIWNNALCLGKKE